VERGAGSYVSLAMIPARVHRFRDPTAVVLGLEELGQRGLTPRGLLFIALDPRGETHIAVPDDAAVVTRIRVGDKLTLKPPWEGRYFHFDAIHRLPGGTVLWNGDRRLADAGSAGAVACAVAVWLKGLSARSVFLGCTPHQAGSWWTTGERAPVIDLHATGFDSAVVTASGLLARRAGEPSLYFLPLSAVRRGELRTGWTEVYRSDLGNIVLLERRILNYSLVLTCERGLVEVDVSTLPDPVRETARVETTNGIAVVGRFDGGAFVVTRGTIEPWGITDPLPAVLVGSANQSLAELGDTLPFQKLGENG
jgi:hypothetical protein